MAFKNTNLSVLAYNTGYILRRNQLISRILSQSSGTRFTPGNGYTYEIFINPGTFTVHTGGYVDLMLIGGGGGGGTGGTGTSAYGGGGGAGGMLHVYNQLLPQGTYTVTIGGGGIGGSFVPLSPTPSPSNRGVDGQNTTISSPSISPISAIGGGGGGGGYSPAPLTVVPAYHGQPGGSGGGAGGGIPYANYGTGTSGQGYPGGQGESPSGTGGYDGGGGGGASESGYTYSTDPLIQNKGGDGASAFSGDLGIPSAYGTPGPGSGRYFSGGGTGGGGNLSSVPVGGGGGYYPSTPRKPGLINTGGGGAGGNTVGYNGGPGIVIIRYLTGAS
jgi:hypothetical protein